jgi:hypothetical protein
MRVDRKSPAQGSTDAIDPYRKSRLLTNGRCDVAKFGGRKTYFAPKLLRGRARGSTTDIAVIDLHEHVAKGEIFSPRRIARGEPNVAFILALISTIRLTMFSAKQAPKYIKT